MKQRFADKLRDIANRTSEDDDVLIKKLNLMFDRYAPELKEKLPEGVQKDLIKLAKQKQYKMTISIDDYSSSKLENQKAITIDDCKKDAKILKDVFIQAKSNPQVDFERHFSSCKLKYKAHGIWHSIYFGKGGILIFSIVLDTYSLEKALRNEGFEVLVSISDSKKLLVKW